MPRDIIILECTEAKAEGKQPSRYTTPRNKKSLRTAAVDALRAYCAGLEAAGRTLQLLHPSALQMDVI